MSKEHAPHAYASLGNGALALALISLTRCGPAHPTQGASLAERQPAITQILPQVLRVAEPLHTVTVAFSQPITPSSLVNDTAIYVAGPIDDVQIAENIPSAVAQGDIPLLPTTVVVSADRTQVALTTSDALHAGEQIAIVVTDAVTSTDGIPFSQTPGDGGTPFVAVLPVVDASVSDDATALITPSTVSSTVPAPTPSDSVRVPTIVVSSATPNATASVENTNATSFSDSTNNNVTSTHVTTAAQPPLVWLNEIYYDAPGSDTNGDCFIELGGAPQTVIGGMTIRLLNGDDAATQQTITLPASARIGSTGVYVVADAVNGASTTTHVANADQITNMDPQNGPDAVQLWSADGALLDVVGYGTPLKNGSDDAHTIFLATPAPDASAGSSITRAFDPQDGLWQQRNNHDDFVISAHPSPGEK